MGNEPSRFAAATERRAYGATLRSVAHRAEHNVWLPQKSRTSVLATLRAAERGRVKELLPIKYGRMAASPFAFFRGAAPVMAADLAGLPVSGHMVQICGDAHVRNLGGYASPAGRVVFDINDFDETCIAPWEWDLKRLAASFVLAGRESKNSDRVCRDAVETLVRAYRAGLRLFSTMPAVELARYHVQRHVQDGAVHKVLLRAERALPLASLKKLTTKEQGGTYTFINRPPLLARASPKLARAVIAALREYRATLGSSRQLVLDAYQAVDVGFKVVGTGSVGTRNYVVLCFGNGARDPLILQVKQAVPSCYEPYCANSATSTAVGYHQGKRVAEGQHRMQSATDPFVGWATLANNHYLVRQLADHKASIELNDLRGAGLIDYAEVCGEIFAKAHARTGDPFIMLGYCGDSPKLDRALGEFAIAYANQATRDYAVFMRAVKAGDLKAQIIGSR